jgi:hypothetical protein
MLGQIGGFFLGILTVLTLAISGVILFIPDIGRYLKMKNM